MRMLMTLVRRGNRLHRRRPSKWLPKDWVYFYVWANGWRIRLTGKAQWGIWAQSAADELHVAGLSSGRMFEWEKPVMKKRTAASAAGDAKHLAPLETDRFKDLLAVVEHMAVRKYDDGDTREPGWVTLKTQGAAWLVQVKDPDGCCSFTAVGETLDKALETAALLLSCDEAPWEPDAWLAASAARKKKK